MKEFINLFEHVVGKQILFKPKKTLPPIYIKMKKDYWLMLFGKRKLRWFILIRDERFFSYKLPYVYVS